MRLALTLVAGLLCSGAALAATPVKKQAPRHTTAATKTASHTTARRTTSHGKSKKSTRSAATAAHPAGMDGQRATQIQSALIKQGYLSGEPTGKWDASSQAAMQRMQSDNGWQTRVVPDSRALIKLGLGPQAAANTAPPAPPK